MKFDTEKYGDEAPLIKPEEFLSWILQQDEGLIVVNKPGWVVCHPSKNGPWSSLVGAAREHFAVEKLHLIARLDRETSGLVLLATQKKIASQLQQAFESRFADKSYLAVLQGELQERREVSKALEPDVDSPVHVKQRVVAHGWGGVKAQTTFIPLSCANGYTLCEVRPFTGRKHQIRAHAQWLGYPIVGDKIYGGDDSLYLEFVENGLTPRLREVLPLPRQALHAWKLKVEAGSKRFSFEAPLHDDMKQFMEAKGLSL